MSEWSRDKYICPCIESSRRDNELAKKQLLLSNEETAQGVHGLRGDNLKQWVSEKPWQRGAASTCSPASKAACLVLSSSAKKARRTCVSRSTSKKQAGVKPVDAAASAALVGVEYVYNLSRGQGQGSRQANRTGKGQGNRQRKRQRFNQTSNSFTVSR